MAKPRKDWKLSEVPAFVVKDETVTIKKPKPASAVVTIVDSVADANAALEHISKVEGKVITVSDLILDYINTNIISNAKIALRNVADPEKAVDKMLEKLRKQFPNLAPEQLVAMSEMLKGSLS